MVFRVQEERPIAVPALGEIKAKVLDAWKLEEARKAALAKAQAAVKAGDLKAHGHSRRPGRRHHRRAWANWAGIRPSARPSWRPPWAS